MLRLTALEFRLEFTKGGAVLPWLGPVLRGGFGVALRSLSCGLRNASCTSCPLSTKCAYGYIFESPPPLETSTHVSHVPHPFVFKPPLLESIRKGQSLDLHLTIIGNAVDYLPYFVLAFRDLGERGIGRHRLPFRLVRAVCLRSRQEIDLDHLTKYDLSFSLDLPDQAPCSRNGQQNFRINFNTPLRLKSKNRRMLHFQFGTFLTAIIRRVELLGMWHCGVDLRRRYSYILDEANTVRTVSDNTHFYDGIRFSKRQARHMPVGGILGNTVMRGDYGSLSGFFEAAKYLSVGNQTSFGLGQVDFALLN